MFYFDLPLESICIFYLIDSHLFFQKDSLCKEQFSITLLALHLAPNTSRLRLCCKEGMMNVEYRQLSIIANNINHLKYNPKCTVLVVICHSGRKKSKTNL